jgi:hypothetical protein
MELAKAKERLKAIDGAFADAPFVLFYTFAPGGRPLHLALTARLRRLARKAGLWGSREMLATLKNAAYGFDDRQARSVGGRDGLFLMDRNFQPANVMMRKLFDRFLDRPDGGVRKLADSLDVHMTDLLPVRLVSHHMRLLGVLARKPDADWLVLVDCDRS